MEVRGFMAIKILGTGFYVPEKIVTNDDLSKMVETSDEWIVQRVGVSERHVSTGETAADFAAAAAKQALESAGMKPEELDLIIAATITSETVCPTVAGSVQRGIGATCPCFDLNSACSGFMFALDTAVSYIARGTAKNVLVIGAERLSKILDWTDRSTCVIFGDGAGAAVVTKGDGYLDDNDHVVTHQANIRIIDYASRRLKVPKEKFFINIDKYGNTSAASVPMALAELNASGKLKRGDIVVMSAFGGGLSGASCIIKW